MLSHESDMVRGLECISEIPGYDPSYTLVYFNSWSSYSEWGWLAFLEKDGKYFELAGGYSSTANNDEDIWLLDEVNQYTALDTMIVFDEICNDVAKDL